MDGGRRVRSGHCTTDQIDHQLLMTLGCLGGLYGVYRARLGLIPTALGGPMLTQELPRTGFAFTRVLQTYTPLHVNLHLNRRSKNVFLVVDAEDETED